MADARRVWLRRLLLFAVGVGIFLLVRKAWGDEGVRTGRIAAIGVLALVFVGLVVMMVMARRRRAGGAASDIVRLLRLGQVNEAVRLGRELYLKMPADPHVVWYYTAALMKSGHVAEARRVFAGLRAESLPPKMAAMHQEIQRALESKPHEP